MCQETAGSTDRQSHGYIQAFKAVPLRPYFVMYIKKRCDSPRIAMITAETVWNNRSIKCFLLEHNTLVTLGQFNDIAVRVPKQHQLCTRRGCHCLKQHMEILDNKRILKSLLKKNKKGEKQHLYLCLQRMANAKVILITLFTTYQSPKCISILI